jgi:ABC-type transporter Mla subunit MlaD
MRRIALIAALIAGLGTAFAASAVGDDSHTYYIEVDNAFGVVNGSEVKVAGVNQGTVEELHINEGKRAVVRVELNGPLAQLGENTVCSLEPQSLIAEYFIDCAPKGPPLEEHEGSPEERAENPDIPVEQTRQTVQQDLVLSAMRQPFKQRLQLMLNEFGTALAGNPENLNAAIRRGAPALTQTRKVTRLLAGQNTIIRDLNANSDEIISKLNERSDDVVSFIREAGDVAEAGAERRDDLSRNFAQLDEFLAELKPTMTELNRVAVTGTPLMRDLRLAGPGLNTLARNLPAFNDATGDSLVSLAGASRVGERALRKGRDEIDQLKRSVRRSYSAADALAKFLADADDPRRAIEIDARVRRETGRSSSQPGTKNTMGYTGLEGLLNYVYYQTGALNQYDDLSHLLHFSIFEVATGPCEKYITGHEGVPSRGATGPPGSPGYTTTRNFNNIHRCVAWLGPNQPGINQPDNLPPYHPSVCPEGSAAPELCNPSGSARAGASRKASVSARAERAPDTSTSDGGEPSGDAPEPSGSGSGGGGGSGDDGPGGLLDLPKAGDSAGKGPDNLDARSGARSDGAGTGRATRDLLGYLLDD